MQISTDGPVLTLHGVFDVRSTMPVRAALRGLLAEHQHVVVDLSDVDAVDVTALRVLAAASMQAPRDGRHVTLRGCHGAVLRLLHLTHLVRLVDLDRDLLSA